MGALREWVNAKLPSKLFLDAGQERYVQKDFDIPPTPQAVIDAGLATTVEEANAVIAASKKYWGGSREHVDMNTMDTEFSAAFPDPMPFAGRPAVYTKLLAADDVKDGTGNKIGEKGYRAIFDRWRNDGLIK